jgi:hypothetical protein
MKLRCYVGLAGGDVTSAVKGDPRNLIDRIDLAAPKSDQPLQDVVVGLAVGPFSSRRHHDFPTFTCARMAEEPSGRKCEDAIGSIYESYW